MVCRSSFVHVAKGKYSAAVELVTKSINHWRSGGSSMVSAMADGAAVSGWSIRIT